MKDIVQFLIKAKRETYAGEGEEAVSIRQQSHDLMYKDADYMYYDTYLGGSKFAGEEAIWIKNKPYWTMNYAGRVIGGNFSGSFLKEALLNVPYDKPFRGPEYFKKRDYVYNCTVNGDFGWFQGYETIYYNDEKIYECHFHGGIVE